MNIPNFKKRIGYLLLLSMVAQAAFGWPSPAHALGIPYAVESQVTLDGLPADGALVKLTDLNTGAFLTDTVGPAGSAGLSGWYYVDLGNLSIPATAGDTLQIFATINSISGTTSITYNPVANPAFVVPATIALVTPPATTFTIYAGAGANGTISPAGTSTLSSGSSTTYTITPNPTFNILNVTVDGIPIGATSSYTFTNVTANHTISATFTAAPLPTFDIISTSSANGSITPLGTTTITSGGSQNYSITPNIGFAIQDVIVDGVSVGARTSYNFTNVTAGHTISAAFAAVPLASFIITSSAGANGSINPMGTNTYTTGASTTYTMTPIAGYEVANLVIDNIITQASTSYTFTNITADHSIVANFRLLPALNSVSISPSSSTVMVGSTTQFTATTLDQYGAAFASPTAWSSSNPSVATINSSGLASTLSVGNTTIYAISGGLIASANLAVTPVPVLASLSLSPASASVVAGTPKQFTVTALDQFSNPIAAAINWSSSNLTVATIDAGGLTTTLSAGTSTITASSGGLTATSTLIVTPVPVLSTINVTSATTSVVVGNSLQFTAAPLDQFNQPFSAVPTWSSSDNAVATVNNSGFVTTLSVGTTTISATNGLVSGSLLLTVTPVPVLTTINITAASSSMIASTTQAFTATTLDQFNNPIAATVTWTSSDISKATISATSGLATALSPGTTTISATSGGISGTTTLTVLPIPPSLALITIIPANSTTTVGLPTQFSASTTDQYGAPFSAALTWSSNNGAVGSMDINSGLFNPTATGTTIVSAINGTVLGSTTLAIIADSISPSIPNGLTATPISSAQIDLSWTASTDNVAVAGYRIFRDGSLASIATTSARTYSDTGLSPSTLYAYTVSAFDAAGNNSGLSTSTSAATQAVSSGGGGGGGGGIGYVIPPTQIPSSTSSSITPTTTQSVLGIKITDSFLEYIKAQKLLLTNIDTNLAKQLAGKILLQVQDHGEAWYVDITSLKRFYLADGARAYGALRRFGLGITNKDLAKIPVGIEKRFFDQDTDGDGLADKLEEGLGTDQSKKDSDGDGVSDYTEIITNRTNPLGTGILAIDTALANKLKGRIVLQVEGRGEAWYINPADGKRYYMKNGDAAYQVMRFLSLGITNDNLHKINIGD